MKRRREHFVLNCSNFAFATIVFIYSILIDAKEMTNTDSFVNTTDTLDYSRMHTIQPNDNEIIHSDDKISIAATITISLTATSTTTAASTHDRPLTTTDNPIYHFIITNDDISGTTTAATLKLANLSKISTHNNSNNNNNSNSNTDAHTTFFNRFTTMRPFIVPTLPDYRHRIAHKQYPSKLQHDRHFGPFFEEPLNTSGTLQVGFHFGTETILNCRVGMLQKYSVMWVRRTTDKVSLLTVGNVTYSGDPRIKVIFQYPNNWRLHIEPTSSDDAGLYMCQVSTHPPRVFATNLTVLAPAIRLVDELSHEVSDRYYKLGSNLEITCQVAISFLQTLPISPPDKNSLLTTTTTTTTTTTSTTTTTIFPFIDTNLIKKTNDISYNGNHKIKWKKDGKELPKDIKINLSSTNVWRNSRISIIHAEKKHSGVYTCSVTNTTTSMVNIQILMGETPAAVQHNHCSRIEIYNIFNMGLLIFSSILHISWL